MQIGRFFNFKKHKEVAPPQSSEVLSHSLIYSMSDFRRYNPDDLIGRKGVLIYKRMMTDEQVKAALRFRRNSVTARGWAFKFDDSETLSDEEMELRIDVLTKALTSMKGSFRSALNGIMSSMHNGFSLSEKTFKSFNFKGKPYWGIKAIRLKPFDTFYFNVEGTGELVSVSQDFDGTITEIDLDRMIHHVHNSEVDYYYGQSELREAYRSYFSKDVLIKLENIFLERSAGGFIWAQPKSGSSIGGSEETKLRNVLRSIMTSTSAIIPANHDLNIEMPKDTQAFDRAIQKHNRAISKALLMPTLIGLSDQNGSGSYSQSQTQLEGFLWMLDSEAEDLAETINEQLIKQLGDYNFGDDVYPKFYFKPLSKSALTQVTDIWTKLVEKKAVVPTETDEDYWRNLLELPEKGEPIQDNKPMDASPISGRVGEPKLKGNDSSNDDSTDTTPFQEPKKTEMSKIKNNDKLIFSKALKRVDFSQIDRSAGISEYQGIIHLSNIMQDILEWSANQVRAEYYNLLTTPNEVKKFKLKPEHKADLKKVSKRIIKNGWRIGMDNGKQELSKADSNRMSKVNFAALTEQAAKEYFENRAFTMAGKLSDDALAIIKNELMTGIKYSKTTEDVIDSIYTAFGKAGLISREVLEDLLGEALNIKSPTARLNTVVRTNLFEAMNEARFSLFTGDDVKGFVTKLEYSAILDSRTTDICKELDNKILLADASEWDKYRPPNHFNCRSLLVPVTVVDDVKIKPLSKKVKDGSIQPAQGFM
ncbi:MAG TPA: DUF935 family protein [Gammaproteobacteria bacterium]|nr:DUF935 family protein [Gammaproteobacteria bacterium]